MKNVKSNLNYICVGVWVIAMCISMCTLDINRSLRNKDVNVHPIEVEGHKYILTESLHGVCTVHAESCQCKQDKEWEDLLNN